MRTPGGAGYNAALTLARRRRAWLPHRIGAAPTAMHTCTQCTQART
jgi:hypothetical protein